MTSLSLTLLSPLETLEDKEVKTWRERIGRAVPHAKYWAEVPWAELSPTDKKECYTQYWEEVFIK